MYVSKYVCMYVCMSASHTSMNLYICDRLHRDARWIDGLSHQSSNLSHLCYLLKKVVVCACSNTGFEQHKVVNYLDNLQTT